MSSRDISTERALRRSGASRVMSGDAVGHLVADLGHAADLLWRVGTSATVVGVETGTRRFGAAGRDERPEPVVTGRGRRARVRVSSQSCSEPYSLRRARIGLVRVCSSCSRVVPIAPSTWCAPRTTTDAAWPDARLGHPDREEHPGVAPVRGGGAGHGGIGGRPRQRGLRGDVGHEVLHRLEAPDRPAELLTLAHVGQDDLDDPLHGPDDLRATAPGRRAGGTARRSRGRRRCRPRGRRGRTRPCRWAPRRGCGARSMADALDRHVGHPPLVAVLPERHDAARVPGPRDVEGDPGRVGTAYGPQPTVVGQAGRLEEPATEHVVLGQRHGRGRRGGEPEQGRGIDPAAAAAARGLAAGEAGQAEVLEPLPQAAVEVDDGGGRGAGSRGSRRTAR